MCFEWTGLLCVSWWYVCVLSELVCYVLAGDTCVCFQ